MVGYGPDPELRDSEQVPLLEPGGIEAFLAVERETEGLLAEIIGVSGSVS